MRRTVPVVVLALLVVLAGCALPWNSESDGQSPPGIENGRLVDVEKLLTAHNRTVIASGFESILRVNGTTTRNGEVVELRQRQRTFVEPGAAEYRYRFRKNVPAFRSDVWGNRTFEASRGQSNAETVYKTGRPTAPRTLSAIQTLGTVIGGRNFTVESSRRTNGTVLYTLRDSSDIGPGFHLPNNATDVRNYSATLVVDRSGRVRSFHSSANYTVAGQPGSMSIDYRLVRTGDVQVDRPNWVSTAVNRSG